MRAPDFWREKSAGGIILSTLLAPLGYAYGYSVRLRQVRSQPFRAKARVVCVGNLTAGGSGKTPLALAIARKLQARGAKVVFLTRGYGGTAGGPLAVTAAYTAADVGDEALLLAGVASTVVSRNRSTGARLCDDMGADVIVMDDGHQNFQLAKDISLVVVGGGGFGNGKAIPAGPLREPVGQGLSRANAVIFMGAPTPLPFTGPILRALTVPEEPDIVRGKSVFAFAGIGEPERFFESLKSMGAEIKVSRAFTDHHKFTEQEIAGLRRAADALKAQLVTTEKDFVRLSQAQRAGILPVRIRAVFEHETAIEALLDRVHPRAKQPLA